MLGKLALYSNLVKENIEIQFHIVQYLLIKMKLFNINFEIDLKYIFRYESERTVFILIVKIL